MEVKLSSKTYFIEGRDETGTIPDGVLSAIVSYDRDGKVDSVFYTHPSILNAKTIPELRKAEEDTRDLNRTKSPAELEKIVTLLEALASK